MNQVDGNSVSHAYHGSEEREQHIQEIQDIKKQLQIVIKVFDFCFILVRKDQEEHFNVFYKNEEENRIYSFYANKS